MMTPESACKKKGFPLPKTVRFLALRTDQPDGMLLLSLTMSINTFPVIPSISRNSSCREHTFDFCKLCKLQLIQELQHRDAIGIVFATTRSSMQEDGIRICGGHIPQSSQKVRVEPDASGASN